jgi:hypothetical protein
VGIGEKENHWAFAEQSQKVLEVLSKFFLLVASGERDHE